MEFLEIVSRLVGRVELTLAGAETHLRDGREALAAGDALKARAQAHAILGKRPGSIVGLALLADACEQGGLSAELLIALTDLSQVVPQNADVWARLGLARLAAPDMAAEAEEALVRALGLAESGSDARKRALLGLTDLDLARGDGARASLWLERLSGLDEPAIALRKAEAAVLEGNSKAALDALEAIANDDPSDGRLALVRGRALSMARAPLAFTHLLRAYVLDARGASEALSSAVAWVEADAETLARVHRAVSGKGDDAQARFRAAFARAAGRSQEAIAALREAVAAGDTGAMRPLALAAIEDHDTEALALALSKLPQESDDALLASARQLLPIAQGAPDESNATAGLDALRNVRDPRLGRYADAVRKALLAHFIPNAPKLAAWDTLLTRLSAHCRRRGDLSALAALGDIAQERRSPVRLAIVGEFNAGKSTFINALIGDDVAPTGVLPTTASLHHLRYAQDPIARVLSYEDEHGATRPDRLLPLGNLRAALKATPEGHVRRVEILVPIASLTRVEILDTPGFNAPDPRHAEAARLAFAEADIVLWLLDASQAMKQSERAVLAEARALGMPVQIFVNKVDRMSEAEVAQVLRVVDEGLAAAGLPTWSRVLPLSARLALEGKMGKQSAQSADDALARSGWPAVQRLLDEEIIGRSTELKEGGLRRRTRAIVTTLAALEFERAQTLDAAQQDQLQRWHARAARAAVIDADLEAHAEMLQGALAGPLRDFTADLEAARLGRAPSTDRPDDPHIDQYRIERAQARLLGPMTQVLCRMGEKSAAWPPGLEADVARGTQLLLTGFFADDQGRLRSLLRQALRHLVSVLRAPEQLPASSDEKQTLRELEDIAAMLADPTSQSFVVPS